MKKSISVGINANPGMEAETTKCPVCGEFEGGEAAVSRHVTGNPGNFGAWMLDAWCAAFRGRQLGLRRDSLDSGGEAWTQEGRIALLVSKSPGYAREHVAVEERPVLLYDGLLLHNYIYHLILESATWHSRSNSMPLNF